MTLLILMVLTFVRPAPACTAFGLVGTQRVVVGKSYDWFFGHGHGALFVNPRGISRTALTFDNAPNPARWTAAFGSVTMTQFGRGVPISGINERGLVVELLQLVHRPHVSTLADIPFVNESQWAQYQLDRFATVADVIANVETLRISRAYTGIHYFVADASGARATIEFKDGQPIIHTGQSLPIPVLTNDYYADLLAYAANHPEPPPSAALARRSPVRFVRAKALTDRVPQTPDDRLMALAWDILDTVRLNGSAADALMEPSQWNIVYDVTARLIAFRTRGAPGAKTLKLADLNVAEGAPELMVDMNAKFTGDVAPHLVPYSFDANAKLVRRNRWLFTLTGQAGKIGPAVEYGRPEVKLSPAF